MKEKYIGKTVVGVVMCLVMIVNILSDFAGGALTVKGAELISTEGWKYTEKNNEVTIIGFSGSETEVTIPNKIEGKEVVGIAQNAFRGKNDITSIKLGNVKTLGSGFISDCSGIKEIIIPKTVTSAWRALAGSSIETVRFEEGIADIPDGICYEAGQVKSVIMPEKEDTLDGYVIGENAFSKTPLASVSIPSSITAIEDSAFSGCELLTEITIPDNVTSIGRYCFDGCKRLKTLTLGKSLKSLGYSFLEGCVNITEFTVPKTITSAWRALAGSSIETVRFEEGIADIPDGICYEAGKVKNVIMPEKEDTLDGYVIGEYAFSKTSLASVSMPSSVTAIEDGAFSGCELLTEITIPDNVTSIGRYCFDGCKRLKTLTLGKSVESLGYNFLGGCVNITEFTVPKTITSAWRALAGSSVETLKIDSGKDIVPDGLAMQCTSLRNVYLSNSVTTIGKNSFSGCTNLERIKSDRNTLAFSSNSFDGCEKLYDSRFTIMDYANTFLVSNAEQSSVNGLINYSLKYKLMPSVAEEAKNIVLSINLPSGLSFVPESVKSNNIIFDPEKINDGEIQVNSTEGELFFSARVTEIGKYQVSASIKFNYNNSNWIQTIGRLDTECPDITVEVPENVNEYMTEVYGLASKGKDVKIYVNDKLTGTFTANAYTGKYSGKVVLPVGKNGSEYSIYASCEDKTSDSVKTIYSSEKPVVKRVVLHYNQHDVIDNTLDITDVFTKGTSPVISYNPAYKTSFEITATNNDSIDRVFVTSTKANSEKYIEAFYNEETGTWITEGYFDEFNHSYVPGSLNVSIIEKEFIILDDSYNYNQDQIFESIPQEIMDNSSVEVIETNKEAVLSNIIISDGEVSGSFQMYSNEDSEGIIIKGEYFSKAEIAANPQKHGFTKSNVKTIENGKTVTYYVLDSDNSDINATMLLNFSSDLKIAKDVWTGKSILKIIEGADADSNACQLANAFITEGSGEYMKYVFGETYGKVGKGLSLGSDFMKYAAQLEMAGDNREYRTAASLLFGLKCFNSFATGKILSAYGIMPPFSTVIKFGINKVIGWIDDYLTDCIENNRQYSFFGFLRFIIDPSGKVYEAVVGNAVEGAIVTVYYKDPATGQSVKWNAEDYDQFNPLTTDNEGKYLWDVPEGEWKVICEKDGYETLETDWMSIPPVRTDVNFSIVSQAAPVLLSADKDENSITVKMSKFVDIATVTKENILLDGFTGNYVVTPVLLDAKDEYSDTFILSGELKDFAGKVRITNAIISYAGTHSEESEFNLAPLVKIGDINRDGEINAKDVTVLRRYLAGGWNVTIIEAASDIDRDGNINAKDVTILRRYLAGGWGVALG